VFFLLRLALSWMSLTPSAFLDFKVKSGAFVPIEIAIFTIFVQLCRKIRASHIRSRVALVKCAVLFLGDALGGLKGTNHDTHLKLSTLGAES
jgi:hypothetical protein